MYQGRIAPYTLTLGEIKRKKKDPEGACEGRLCSIPGGYHSKEEAADGT